MFVVSGQNLGSQDEIFSGVCERGSILIHHKKFVVVFGECFVIV